MTTRRSAPPVLAAALILLPALAHAAAGPYDHLKCHRVGRGLNPRAIADLQAHVLDQDLSAQGCKIGRADTVCVPVIKKNVQPPPANTIPVTPNLPALRYVCYEIECPRAPKVTKTMKDQFGTHTFPNFTAYKLCSPTATSLLFYPACGDSVDYPACDGFCPAGETCIASAASGSCRCQPDSATPPCGEGLGIPQCAGTCPPELPACREINGGCNCSD